MKLFFLFLLVTLICISCSPKIFEQSEQIVKQGSYTYKYKGGCAQCLSQINCSGKIVVLVTSLKKNTKANITSFDPECSMISFAIRVDQETDCRSHTEVREIHLPLDPVEVPEFTLTGKVVYEDSFIKLMEDNDSGELSDFLKAALAAVRARELKSNNAS